MIVFVEKNRDQSLEAEINAKKRRDDAVDLTLMEGWKTEWEKYGNYWEASDILIEKILTTSRWG